MSKLDELVQELCPDGVERVALGEVTELKRGTSISKKNIQTGEVPVIAGGLNPAYYIDKPNREGKVIVVAGSGANAGFVSFWDEPVFVSDAFSIQSHNDHLLLKFVFHVLKSKQDQLHDLKKGGGVPHVYAKDAAVLQIPLPPLGVQEEIVRILDQFVELDRELEEEIAGREKQFQNAREALLDVVSAGTVRIGDLATVARGASPRPIKKFTTDDPDGIPWIKIGDVPVGGKFITQTAERVTQEGAQKSRMVYPGDFVLSNSMSFGRPYITQIEGAIHDGWLSISDFEDSCIPDYLYYLLSSGVVQSQFARVAGSGTVSNLNSKVVQGVGVPLPPLEVQEEIATKLDTFTEYVDNLKRERELRQKQYEYYRDQLLDFDAKE
ncbi:restriction endonuclease subunit S [uncultured Corynebacterium sp.]|uniref:restriction endonuclease subunit S n=1 Tax=uncultured Corynebacterium sp. TaxID=159447 RepID=UPI00259BDE4D|nr:restriction endonuclease subunit S [uncultured Corynebacterium sp.]